MIISAEVPWLTSWRSAHLSSPSQHMKDADSHGTLQRLSPPIPIPELKRQLNREEMHVQMDDEVPIACRPHLDSLPKRDPHTEKTEIYPEKQSITLKENLSSHDAYFFFPTSFVSLQPLHIKTQHLGCERAWT